MEQRAVHHERIKLYSAAAIEKALPVLSRRMLNEKEPLSSAVECGKFLARNAGIGDAKQPMSNNSERQLVDRYILPLDEAILDQAGLELLATCC